MKIDDAEPVKLSYKSCDASGVPTAHTSLTSSIIDVRSAIISAIPATPYLRGLHPVHPQFEKHTSATASGPARCSLAAKSEKARFMVWSTTDIREFDVIQLNGSKAQLDIETLSADTIMQAIGSAGSKLNIVILDACRNSPFRSFRAVTRGLAAIDAPQGTLVAFSTAPGQAARDGAAGANSPYSAALGEMLGQPGLRIEDVFKRVRQRVNQETNGEQTPWESSSLVGDFYPAGGGAPTLPVPQFNPVPAFNPPPSPPPPLKTQYYYVWDARPPDDWLALRTEPGGRAGRRLAQLPNGTLLEVLEQRPDNWWRVRAIGWNMEGWVLSKQGNRVWVYCCRSQ